MVVSVKLTADLVYEWCWSKTTFEKPMKRTVISSRPHFCMVDGELFLTLAQGTFARSLFIRALSTLVSVTHVEPLWNALVSELFSHTCKAVFVGLADCIGCIQGSFPKSWLGELTIALHKVAKTSVCSVDHARSYNIDKKSASTFRS